MLEEKIDELNKSVEKAVQTIQELQEKYEKQKEINKELVDENEKLKDKNAKLKKRIEEYNLCGNTVDKQTYNEAANELTFLKGIIHSMVIAFNNYECAGPVQEQENTWEILRDIMHEELYKMEGKK